MCWHILYPPLFIANILYFYEFYVHLLVINQLQYKEQEASANLDGSYIDSPSTPKVWILEISNENIDIIPNFIEFLPVRRVRFDFSCLKI